ncbi:MAG TPA: nematoblast specific protein [Cytophagales bacterium]|jgi:hypothetical protein|nr:nematoblast specific protein [Cytophagales bacterium]
MQFYFLIFISSLLLLPVFNSVHVTSEHDSNKVSIPIGGNSWVNTKALITNDGLRDWLDSSTVCTTYFRVSHAGNLKLSLLLNTLGSSSTLKITINGKSTNVSCKSEVEKEFFVGEWKITKTGYVAVKIQGIQKSLEAFGNLSTIFVSGSAVTTDMGYVKNNEGNFFYWGRRGPSVHLHYNTSGIENIEWFYNEITVPLNNDVIGSYYMANGFGEGYFGMQVNSETERRILFSVWSPYQTDNPNSIPKDQRVKLIKKGENTTIGEFGNEGAGGQSYLKYNWKTGNTYKFLLQGKPGENNCTLYTAYFFAPEENKWILIASLERPKTSTYLTNLYSFLENFTPETGNKSRMALYGNQWVRTLAGRWISLNEAELTADDTANKGFRKDYAGGVSDNKFFLKNCGFFDESTELNQNYEVPKNIIRPNVDVTKFQ